MNYVETDLPRSWLGKHGACAKPYAENGAAQALRSLRMLPATSARCWKSSARWNRPARMPGSSTSLNPTVRIVDSVHRYSNIKAVGLQPSAIYMGYVDGGDCPRARFGCSLASRKGLCGNALLT